MSIITIPAHAVIMIIGGRNHDRAMELCTMLDMAHPEPWSVNDPEDSTARIKRALGEHDLVRVFIRNSHAKARADVARLAKRHGFSSICLRLPDGDKVDAAVERIDALYEIETLEGFGVEITPMPTDRRDVGLLDAIGDIHGCIDELRELLTKLGHLDEHGVPRPHADGRTLVFLGDYTDRGPANAEVLTLIRAFTAIGALALKGNHDYKLSRWLMGNEVEIKAGLEQTVAELQGHDDDWKKDMGQWLTGLQTHYVLDGGRLVAAHAGLKTSNHGRSTPGAEKQALYGNPIKGGRELDEEGFPLAEDWAQEHDGITAVVHGHVVHPSPRVVNQVYAIDTGLCFGGSLTALRWPEREFVQVKARRTYFDPRGRDVEEAA